MSHADIDPDLEKILVGAATIHGLLGDSIEAFHWCLHNGDPQMIAAEREVMALTGQMIHANAEGRWEDAERLAVRAVRLAGLQRLRHEAHQQSPN